MLTGTLDDFSVPDLFRLLSTTKKTGRLELRRAAGTGSVYFESGEVYYAESTLVAEPLGQRLVRAGAMTEGRLRKALDEHADSGERVGQVLLASGAVTEEELSSAVKSQIEDAAFDLLQWEVGDFSWESETAPAVEIPIAVSVENLIMEASRRLDELEVIMRKIPGCHAVPALAPAPPEGAVEINIAPGEWRVLVHVDGRRTVGEIAELLALDELEVMRTLYGLVAAGLVAVTSSDDGADEPFVRPDLEARHESENEVEGAAEEPASPAALLLGELAAHPRLDGGATNGDGDRSESEATPDRTDDLAGPPPRVDRAAVVRELASLFDDRRTGSGDSPAGPPATPRRVEDDLSLNKGLIARLIDGVKGL